MLTKKYLVDDVFVRENLNLLPISFLTAKDSEILARLSSLLRNWPDPNLYPSLLISLLRLPLPFKKIRSIAHLTRLIAAEYFYKRKVLDGSPQRRRLFVKLLRTSLEYPFGTRRVLGMVVTFNLMKQKEAFEEQHIIEAVQRIIPHVKGVEDSFVDAQDWQMGIHSVYLEIEKDPPTSYFTIEEIQSLQKALPSELKGCIEQLVPMTFMRRNEEEVYRNILALRDQLKTVRDIPQMTISFEEQTQFDLFFTVVLLRLVKGKEPSVKEVFEKSNPDIVFIPDRVDLVGSLRKLYQKEATVFRLQLPKSHFYRKDRSVNLYKARRTVVALINKAIGHVRDYNGGLILKQNERLEDFLSVMPNGMDEFLLENFFYSITPIAMQSILPALLVKDWFLAFQDLCDQELPKKNPYILSCQKQEEAFIIIIRADDMTFKEEILSLMNRMQIPSLELAFSEIKIHGSYCFGLLYRPSQLGQENFLYTQVHQLMEQWSVKVVADQTLVLALSDSEPTLDPRITKTDQSYIIIKMLFEGLTRMGRDGQPQMTIAQSYEVSSDYKRYIFHLRECKWSNEAPITAQDFEYSWKKALNPHTRSIYGESLFILKNARRAKEKKVPLDQVGVHALDDRTLVVDLEYSAPFFLEVVSHWTFSLINSVIDRTNPGWAYQAGEKFVCNGPFTLAQWNQHRKLVVVKNPHYWDADSVHLNQISITMVNQGQNEMRMLQTGQLDLIGRPMTVLPPAGLEHNLDEVDLVTYPLYGLVALALNTQQFPFNHKKIRQAFAYAIDYALLDKFVGHEYGGPCNSLLPSQLSLHTKSLFPVRDLQYARMLFQQGLGEIGFVKSDFPRLSLSFPQGKYQEALFASLAKQWKEAFGIEVHLESTGSREHYERMTQGRYQMASFELRAMWKDPLHLFDMFDTRGTSLSFPGEGYSKYRLLLQQAKQEDDLQLRRQYLAEAEELLAEEMPILPLYQLSGHMLKKRGLKGVFVSECFQVDFKWTQK
ncbi:MAG: peptide ABC transporter substrate-binding protein [Verrucomicrobia bacterium]|nr:peptide ABC transporter substrate-binding protein [Verrucomicrobiota bacterium]MBS0646590.1 peptide ABC transporter substrate-binding protein [Verrucomicrobiota bacterium]